MRTNALFLLLACSALFVQRYPLFSSPVSITMTMAGASERDEKEGTSIQSRHQAVDVGLKASMPESTDDDTAFAFIYGADAVLRFFLSEYPGEDQQQVQLLASGPAFTGIRIAPFSYLVMGYAPMNLWSTDLSIKGSEAALRHSSYPGLHLHFQHRQFGSLRITPLAFIDPPGRFTDSPFFLSTIQQSLSMRQREGRHDSAHAPDRINHQIRYDLTVDWFFMGLQYRKAGFKNTGSSDRSILTVDHAGLDLGVITGSVDLLVGAVRSSGSLTMAGAAAVPVMGMQYRLSLRARLFEQYGISVFAMRSEADRTADAYGDRRVGFVDYGAPSTDLPLFETAQLHGLPCVPVPEDRCDGLIIQNTPPFRYPGDYGDLTLQYQGEQWGVALRGGILVPFRYRNTNDGAQNEKAPYNDHAGWAAELQLSPDFMKGSVAVTYSVLYDRDEEHKRRLQAQSLTLWFRLPLPIDSGSPSNTR